MRGNKLQTGLAALLALGLVTPLVAAPVDQVRARIAGFRSLGSAFKTVNDSVRSGQVRTPQFQAAAAQIQNAGRQQYAWFPRGTGPQAGIKTEARVEIWTRGREFRTAQDAFARQADNMKRAAMSGNVDLIRGEARKLGATCKACHDNFREED